MLSVEQNSQSLVIIPCSDTSYASKKRCTVNNEKKKIILIILEVVPHYFLKAIYGKLELGRKDHGRQKKITEQLCNSSEINNGGHLIPSIQTNIGFGGSV